MLDQDSNPVPDPGPEPQCIPVPAKSYGSCGSGSDSTEQQHRFSQPRPQCGTVSLSSWNLKHIVVRYDTSYLFYGYVNAHRHSVSALVAKQSKNHLYQSLKQVRVRNLQLNVATNSARKQSHNVILSMFYLFIIYFILLIQETNTSRSQQARSAAWWMWISPGIRMVSGTHMLFCVLNSLRIRDILVRIRIRGSVSLTDGSDSGSGLDPSSVTFKIATIFFAYYFLKLRYIYIIFQRKEVTKQ